jgi:isopenicillin N synthase-like dioxygenase
MPSTLDLRQSDRTREDDYPSVPVIDARHLRAGGNSAVDAALLEAMRVSGFLYLEHVFDGTDTETALQRQMQRFFALPDDDARKQEVCVRGRPVKYGFMPLFGEPAYQPGTVAHVESFDCGRPGKPGDASDRRSLWPDLPGFHDTVRAAWSELSHTGYALLECIASALGVDRRFLVQRCDSQDLSTLRLLHYPPTTDHHPDRDVGIAAHTDFECITLLYQSAPGLELLDVGGHWRDAPANNEQVVVLFGDMLERFTNGICKATGHRVRTTSRERYSVVLFFAVNDGVVVEPVRSFVRPGDAPCFAPVTQRAHSQRDIARAEENREQLVRS